MKILIPPYSLKLKNIILFLNHGLIFFPNGDIRKVVSTLPNVVKIDAENDNVVSTLSNFVQFNVGIYNVVSTFLNVVNFNLDVQKVVSTLIWRCATSRRHINLKATLNGRWNVCWIDSLPNNLNSSQATMWLQSSMWSLTEIDNVPLKCLPVRGDTPCCFQTLTFMCLKVFPNIWSMAVSALKIIDLART